MAGSIPVHLRHSSSGRNPSPSGSSMLGCWPEAVTARTGYAASGYPGDVSSPQARTLEFGGADTFAASGYPGDVSSPQARTLEFGGANTFAASGYPGRTARSVVALVVVLLMWIPGPAGAEARLLDVSPADGSSLATLQTVEFEFDSLLIADGAEVTVTKLDGTAFSVEASVDGSTLTGTVVGELPSGNYEVGYSVRSSDGDTNTGSIRVGVDAPEQALSGGLLAVIGIALGLFAYLGVVFRADKKRRPGNQRR